MTELKIISRADAQALGLKKYFTGKPCKNGHVAERYVLGPCEECARERHRILRESDPAHAQRDRERMRLRRSDPNYRKRELERQREIRSAKSSNEEYIDRRRANQRRRYSERMSSDQKFAEAERERNRNRMRLKRRDTEYTALVRQKRRKRRETDQAWAEKDRERQRRRQRDNLEKYAAAQAKRRAAKLQRTPVWLTKQQIRKIAWFYDEAKRLSRETGEKWHVDHIIPLQGEAVSGLHVPWNLQVIPAKENIRKKNKLLDAA